MTSFYEHLVTVFIAFFAIMNPIANTAVFAGLTSTLDKSQQRQVAVKSLWICFLVILIFCLLGKSIFHLCGITLPALRITGGVLVFLVGYHMLQGKHSRLHTTEADQGTDIAVSPLAIPLLAGPGTIATAMNYSAAAGWQEIIITILAFTLLCIITLVCFIFSSKITAFIGSNGLDIITRLMGLILSVIGVQMIILGVQDII